MSDISDKVSEVSRRESAFFDELLMESGKFDPFTEHGWKVLADRFKQCIGGLKSVELLDVGCGSGASRRLYIAHTKRYVGIDLSNKAISIAEKDFPADEWHQGDACHLPFENESFDVVAFSSVLHHIPEFVHALREANRVLRPGGVVFAFDPNLLHPAMALFRYPASPCYISKGVSPDERPLLPRELRTAFEAAGFIELWQRGQANIPYRSVEPRIINALLSIYNMFDYVYEKIGLGRFFGTFIITSAIKRSD